MAEYAAACLSLCLAAYRREADFFLAKPALQLAAMGSLRDANAYAAAFAAGVAALMAAQAAAGWGGKAASPEAAARAAAEAVAAASTIAPPPPASGSAAAEGADAWADAGVRALGAAVLSLMRAQSAAFGLPSPEAHPPLPASLVLGTPLSHFTGFALQAMEVRRVLLSCPCVVLPLCCAMTFYSSCCLPPSLHAHSVPSNPILLRLPCSARRAPCGSCCCPATRRPCAGQAPAAAAALVTGTTTRLPLAAACWA